MIIPWPDVLSNFNTPPPEGWSTRTAIENGESKRTSGLIDARCKVCTAGFNEKVKGINVLLESLAVDACGSDVRPIVNAGCLLELEIATPEPVLDPQIGCGKMANLAQPTSAAYAYGR